MSSNAGKNVKIVGANIKDRNAKLLLWKISIAMDMDNGGDLPLTLMNI